MASSSQPKHEYVMRNLRTKILYNHLQALLFKFASPELIDMVAYAASLSLLDTREIRPDDALWGTKEVSVEPVISAALGGLTKKDVLNLFNNTTKWSKNDIDGLSHTLETTLQSIQDFYYLETGSEHAPDQRVQTLPGILEEQRQRVDELEADLHERRRAILGIMNEFDEVQAQLQYQVTNSLRELPPIIHAQQSALHDFLSLTIETALLKLSLLRARAHSALYAHVSAKRPDAIMRRALASAHERFLHEQTRMDEEERILNAQLSEYEELLGLVDGSGSSGYAQIVEDRAKVKKETDECRRDLRRLGWTGD